MNALISALDSTHYFIMVMLLIFLLFTIGKFSFKINGGEPFGSMEDKTTLLVLILSHIQILIGIVLLTAGPMSVHFSDMGAAMKDPNIRMMVVEHPLTMIIGVAMITIARLSMKKQTNDTAKYKRILIFYGIALILFLIRIPWSHING